MAHHHFFKQLNYSTKGQPALTSICLSSCIKIFFFFRNFSSFLGTWGTIYSSSNKLQTVTVHHVAMNHLGQVSMMLPCIPQSSVTMPANTDQHQ